jgi:rubredoxin
VKLDWNKIPIELPCPKCQGEEDAYEELEEDEWRFVLSKNQEPLKDYHKCPHCEKVWIILRPHIDEDS